MKRFLITIGLVIAMTASATAQLAPSVTATSPTFATGAGGTFVIDLRNSGAIWHKLTIIPNGTLTTCAAALDSSPDNVTYTGGGAVASFNCANLTFGMSSVPLGTNFVRINITNTLAGATVQARYDGFVMNPQETACSGENIATLAISNAAAATTQIKAAATGQRIYVCGGMIVAAGATTVQFVGGTGANCASVTNTFTGVMTLATGTPLMFPTAPGTYWQTNPTAALCIVNSAAVQVSGYLMLAQVPF